VVDSGLLQLLTTVNNAAVNVSVPMSLQDHYFNFLPIPRDGIAVLYNNSVFALS
jgi:hypothetical protein